MALQIQILPVSHLWECLFAYTTWLAFGWRSPLVTRVCDLNLLYKLTVYLVLPEFEVALTTTYACHIVDDILIWSVYAFKGCSFRKCIHLEDDEILVRPPYDEATNTIDPLILYPLIVNFILPVWWYLHKWRRCILHFWAAGRSACRGPPVYCELFWACLIHWSVSIRCHPHP